MQSCIRAREKHRIIKFCLTIPSSRADFAAVTFEIKGSEIFCSISGTDAASTPSQVQVRTPQTKLENPKRSISLKIGGTPFFTVLIMPTIAAIKITVP